MAEQKLKPILKQGTKKNVVQQYLSKKDIANHDTTGRDKNGKCRTARAGNFKWNCEYSSYVGAGWATGFLSINPYIQVFFVFNEKNELVNYYTDVSYTFI